MHPIFARRLASSFAGLGLVIAPAPALADNHQGQADAAVNRVLATVPASSAAIGLGAVGLVAGAAVGCGLGFKSAGAGAACAIVTAGIFLNKLMADDSIGNEAGQRLLNDPNLPVTFSGTAISPAGTVIYSGSRTGALVQGTYSGPEGSGEFLGALQRNGTISGGYAEGEELGVFSGTITPELDQVFGASQCTDNCD